MTTTVNRVFTLRTYTARYATSDYVFNERKCKPNHIHTILQLFKMHTNTYIVLFTNTIVSTPAGTIISNALYNLALHPHGACDLVWLCHPGNIGPESGTPCTVLYSFVQFCTVLYSFVQFCTILHASIDLVSVYFGTKQGIVQNSVQLNCP